MVKQIINNDCYKGYYNYYLERFYSGCDYLSKHVDEIDKYLPNLLNFLNTIELLITKISETEKMSTDQILNGFKEIEPIKE